MRTVKIVAEGDSWFSYHPAYDVLATLRSRTWSGRKRNGTSAAWSGLRVEAATRDEKCLPANPAQGRRGVLPLLYAGRVGSDVVILSDYADFRIFKWEGKTYVLCPHGPTADAIVD